jgi:hypothetical protein
MGGDTGGAGKLVERKLEMFAGIRGQERDFD